MQQPVILTIFGITGDLSRTRLLPAMYDLFIADELPEKFLLIGFGRRDWTQEDYAQFITKSLGTRERLADFLQLTTYHKGELTDVSSFESLTQTIERAETEFKSPSLRLFYCAISPEYYTAVTHNLAASKLNSDTCTRILVEKPFGRDLATADDLETTLRESFSEEQIYRIDHYLEKTSAKQILDFRFYHRKFESLWNSHSIDRIDILLSDDSGIGTRAGYYDSTGAVRDMIQNHGLMLATLVTMPAPANADSASLRMARASALEHIVATQWETGQYASYVNEPNIPADSQTETFARVTFESNDPAWVGTPITVTTGKKLPEKRTEITVSFKPSLPIRAITFRLHPKPAIILALADDHTTIPINETGDGYSAVILDAIAGNQTFFVHHDEIIAAWQALIPVLDSLPQIKPAHYPDNSPGPNVTRHPQPHQPPKNKNTLQSYM